MIGLEKGALVNWNNQGTGLASASTRCGEVLRQFMIFTYGETEKQAVFLLTFPLTA